VDLPKRTHQTVVCVARNAAMTKNNASNAQRMV